MLTTEWNGFENVLGLCEPVGGLGKGEETHHRKAKVLASDHSLEFDGQHDIGEASVRSPSTHVSEERRSGPTPALVRLCEEGNVLQVGGLTSSLTASVCLPAFACVCMALSRSTILQELHNPITALLPLYLSHIVLVLIHRYKRKVHCHLWGTPTRTMYYFFSRHTFHFP